MNPVSGPFQHLEMSAMSRHFSRFMQQLAETNAPELECAATMLCQAAEQGHVCLDLQEAVAQLNLPDAQNPLPFQGAPEWIQRLHSFAVVGQPGEHRPLILDEQGRLYLYRLWRHERFLAEELRRRGELRITLPEMERMRAGVERLFGRGDGLTVDWQRVAAVVALLRSLCVISGGPGTGKTSTVVKILALLLEQAGQRPLSIALAAPTGKAAARLAEAIRLARSSLAADQAIRARIPDEALTLHRLLGSTRRVGFRHHRHHLLPWDVVIVDEASMVDLPMMSALLQALAPQSRLILLGDRDQLASVEAGAVLGDICAAGSGEGFSAELAADVAHLCGDLLPVVSPSRAALVDNVVILRHSYRFSGQSGIGRLAQLINQGAADECLALLGDPALGDVCRQSLPPAANLESALETLLVEVFSAYLQAGSVSEALEAFARVRLLAALRRGPFGVEQLNRLIEKVLMRRGLLQATSLFYSGRPIMVTGNDYRLGLFNGDVGLLWPDAQSDGALRVFFPQADGGLRKIIPSRLPPHETVFAMTVHKSQGSEFDRVVLMLPDSDSELLTRELLYTAVTRARQTVEIWSDEACIVQAVRRRVVRHSGLREGLQG